MSSRLPLGRGGTAPRQEGSRIWAFHFFCYSSEKLKKHFKWRRNLTLLLNETWYIFGDVIQVYLYPRGSVGWIFMVNSNLVKQIRHEQWFRGCLWYVYLNGELSSISSSFHRTFNKFAPHSNSNLQCKNKMNSDSSKSNSRAKMTRDEYRQARKARNIESAKRSRSRLKNRAHWDLIQIEENKDKITQLERRVHELSEELMESPRKSKQKRKDALQNAFDNKYEQRPNWFGEPF